VLSIFHPLRLRLTLLLLTPCVAAQPLFDAHVHYNAEDAAYYSPQQILDKLDQSQVRKAAVTSTPTDLVLRLYRFAPDRIVPLLGAYRKYADKLSWPQDESLPARMETELAKGGWRGIGELHIFAKDRHSPVFLRIVELAGQYKLPLLLHTDPAVIDTVYETSPQQPVVWAHAGTYPYPELLADYLERYPALTIDLSVRDERIAPHGEILDPWYELFLAYPDRCMIGVDTYRLSRWHDYTGAAHRIRQWTRQLPPEVASRLVDANAAAIFDADGDRVRVDAKAVTADNDPP